MIDSVITITKALLTAFCVFGVLYVFTQDIKDVRQSLGSDSAAGTAVVVLGKIACAIIMMGAIATALRANGLL